MIPVYLWLLPLCFFVAQGAAGAAGAALGAVWAWTFGIMARAISRPQQVIDFRVKEDMVSNNGRWISGCDQARERDVFNLANNFYGIWKRPTTGPGV